MIVISHFSESEESHSGHWKYHWIQGNDEIKELDGSKHKIKYLLIWGV